MSTALNVIDTKTPSTCHNLYIGVELSTETLVEEKAAHSLDLKRGFLPFDGADLKLNYPLDSVYFELRLAPFYDPCHEGLL